MAAEINVIEKTRGKHIKYAVTEDKKIIFGENELTVNLAARERDHEVTLDICTDNDGGIVIGTGGKAQRYVAQIIIPARKYETEGREEETTLKAMDFNMESCTIILWGAGDNET